MGQAPSLLEVVKTSGSDKSATTNIANLIQQYKTQIDINAANDDGKTALHLAAEQGLADVVVLLLENGADPTRTDNQLCTPLMNAVFIGNAQTAEALLTNDKTDINAVNKDGMTSLHWAILRRHYECVELLIRQGANTELKNAKGQTAIDMLHSLKPKQREKMDEFVKQCLSGASPKIPTTGEPPTPSKSGSNATTRSNSVSNAQIAAASRSSHVRKLFALCKVWGLVKFIHPYFIHKEIDWDEALVNTIPKMIAAENTQEYKAVVNQLLSVLGDANTRCSEVEEPVRPVPDAHANQHREQPYSSVTDDGVAVLVATAHDKFQDYSRMLNFLNCFKEISPILTSRPAQAIVFDLRLRKGSAPLNSAAGPFKYMFFEAMKLLLTHDIHLPCYRQRVFSGFPQQRNFGNIFQSGVLTLEGETLSPPPGLESPKTSTDKSHRKWIFIINKGTPDSIVDLLSALQPEGLAAVVYDKHDKEPLVELGIPSIQINIGDNLSVTVRKSERLNYDGTVGFQPDVVIHSSPNDVDAAMQTALEIARGAKKIEFAQRPTSPLYIKKLTELEYSQMSIPTVEYRLLSLFRFWNIVQYFFPYKNLLDREWDEVLAEFIPKMEEADTAIDYALTVAELVSNIKDSHGNCSSPLLSAYIGTYIPPFEVKFVEGQTVVTHLFDPAVKTHGINLGDVIVTANGEPIENRRNRLSQLMSASTPQALQSKVHQKLLAGEKDSTIQLEVYTPGSEDAAANIRKVTLTRSLLPVAKSQTKPSYAILPDGFGFIDTVSLSPVEVEKALETIKETPALILDIRGYPKGTIYAIAPRLTSKKVDVAITQTPYLQPSMLYSELESCVIEETHKLQPSAGWKYKGKVVVLINEETISHAEHSCLYLEAATDVTFVGTPTNGANGNVTNCYLPGGILVAFTGLGTQHADKSQLQRKGIQPHIRVDPTIAAARESQDIVLDAAVRYLKNHFAIKEVASVEKSAPVAAPATTSVVETPKSPSPKTPPASTQNGTPTTQRKV